MTQPARPEGGACIHVGRSAIIATPRLVAKVVGGEAKAGMPSGKTANGRKRRKRTSTKTRTRARPLAAEAKSSPIVERIHETHRLYGGRVRLEVPGWMAEEIPVLRHQQIERSGIH